ncbi:GNAT family N-acetyltransferase [Flavobacterium sp. ASW18X]|uniref:GNAT family N-acetyltransferase n=1 Tax=Flavobacterium sp. ASW18X TaxID=2572595 RepID=UPI0010ADD935|nr:GNAT family N-acetyltransferase [Flavobacterium sp. ASW18X]TKD65833.1 GNAT family N-acetyltransferase [Flavobacterium sp. ASW18X]
MNTPVIRKITPKDNAHIAAVVRKVLEDLGVPKVGTAYADKALDNMYNAYKKDRSDYFVVEANGKVIGCAGIAPLDNYEGNVCELQKMYFLEEARGLGLGAKMITTCINQAMAYGFEAMYLETMPYMEAAQKLYKKNGFEYIDAPMGCTGHSACPVYMLRKL